MVRIGTAGWTIPPQYGPKAPGEGSHLERYARVLSCAEINSSFYRSHRASTWLRWSASTPATFRFSVKFPKAITHGAKLAVPGSAMDAFLAETALLGPRLGPILVQLPPSLGFEDCPAAEFFEALRDRTETPIALEPRHPSWFSADADDLLLRHRISRVSAHPSREPGATPDHLSKPGGWPGLAYFRLHGAPRTYYSSYEPPLLHALAEDVKKAEAQGEVWVIFDNTAHGHAFPNALDLKRQLAAVDVPENEKGTAAAVPSVKRKPTKKSSSRTRSSSSSSD